MLKYTPNFLEIVGIIWWGMGCFGLIRQAGRSWASLNCAKPYFYVLLLPFLVRCIDGEHLEVFYPLVFEVTIIVLQFVSGLLVRPPNLASYDLYVCAYCCLHILFFML